MSNSFVSRSFYTNLNDRSHIIPYHIVRKSTFSIFLLNYNNVTLLQASTNVITLYLNMSRVQYLLDQVEKFWKIDDMNDEDVRIIKKRLKYFQWFFYYFLVVGMVTVAVGYLYKPYFTSTRVLIYDGLVPDNEPMYYFLLIVETYSIWITGFACSVFDLFLATMLQLTSTQFRILGIEFKSLIGTQVRTEKEKKESRERMKKCIDHHNFLLG